jgi:radical SAM protein
MVLPVSRRSHSSGRSDFADSPLIAFYEATRACDLCCRHCRASAQPQPSPAELDTKAALRLIAQFASFPRPPALVLTGGDPFKRPDLEELVAQASKARLDVALTPSATPLVTYRALNNLRWSGLRRIALSLDGACAATHDRFRGVAGSFKRTLEILADARDVGLELQVNTTVSPHNMGELDDLADLLSTTGIRLWSLFFVVPVGRATDFARLSPDQYELVFARLWGYSQHLPFGIKTTAAPHYRRFVAERMAKVSLAPIGFRRSLRYRATRSVNDGKGVIFVSHAGVISPSGFLPLACGVFPDDSVVDIYQKHPVFRALRQPDLLQGKCGACPYRSYCGGSRARAFAVTGNLLAAEPDCQYVPPGWRGQSGASAAAIDSA